MPEKTRKVITRYQVKAVIFDVQAECSHLKQRLASVGISAFTLFWGIQAEKALKKTLSDTGFLFSDCLLITNNEKHSEYAATLGFAVAGCLEGHFEIPKNVPLLENLDEVPVNYLNQVYCHAKKIPATIAETSRCFLCELTEADAEAMYEIVTEKETAEFLTDRKEKRKDSTKEMTNQRQEEIQKLVSYAKNVYSFFEYAYWGIFYKETGELIGRAGFQEGTYPLEVGYVIKRSEWGKGLATEVLMELVRYAGEELDCTEVHAVIDEKNKASLRVAEKCGVICNRLRHET